MCKGYIEQADHKWGGGSGKSCRSIGTREEWSCNNCMAVKITFRIYAPTGNDYTENTVIVEPLTT
jgi:hypothetical protein